VQPSSSGVGTELLTTQPSRAAKLAAFSNLQKEPCDNHFETDTSSDDEDYDGSDDSGDDLLIKDSESENSDDDSLGMYI
jgi:hypothetical protein